MTKMTKKKLNDMIRELAVGERLTVPGLDETLYHSIEGIGSSLLKAADQSLAHYKAAIDHVPEENRSAVAQENLDVGSATHCAVLEPEIFNKKFIVIPESIPKRAGAEWKAFAEKHKEKTILRQVAMEKVDAMANAVLDGVGHYFVDGEAELSYFYKHESGLILKARGDYVRGDAVFDLKTTVDKNPGKFSRTVKYEYSLQDALYRLVSGKADMMFVGIEKTPPHSVYLCKEGADVRQKAEKRVNEVITELAFAIEFQEFPSYPVELCETELTAGEREREAA